MKVLLVQFGGAPNIAIMRVAAHHRALGDEIELRKVQTLLHWQSYLWDQPDRVYVSCVFEKHRYLAESIRTHFPAAIIGGTGWNSISRLEDYGITTLDQDYSIYPNERRSVGFTQRGCRLKCGFCVVPKKEGAVREENTIYGIWRGPPWPKHILLLDNDFFGQPNWRERIREIREGGFKVSFNQGINVRFINDETADAIASVQYYDDSFTTRRLYTAWDAPRKNMRDGVNVASGLWKLRRRGVNPDHIMVYMLIGYWHGETDEDRELRRRCLRKFGARPYPMPFVRTPDLVGFQRFCCGAYDKRISWADWKRNNYRPEGLDGGYDKHPEDLFS